MLRTWSLGSAAATTSCQSSWLRSWVLSICSIVTSTFLPRLSTYIFWRKEWICSPHISLLYGIDYFGRHNDNFHEYDATGWFHGLNNLLDDLDRVGVGPVMADVSQDINVSCGGLRVEEVMRNEFHPIGKRRGQLSGPLFHGMLIVLNLKRKFRILLSEGDAEEPR